MKLMKKIFSAALVLCLVLSCAAVAFAEEDVLNIKVTSVPAVKAGAPIADGQVGCELPEGIKGETVWMVWGVEHDEEWGDSENWILAEGEFDPNGVYMLQLKVTAEEGYTLPESVEFEDLTDPENCAWSTEYDEEGNVVNHTFDLGVYTLTVTIDRVEILLSEVKVGGMPGVESVKLFVGDAQMPETAAELTSTWYSLLDNYDEMTGAFEDDKVYQIQAKLRAAKGYSFDDSTAVYINGEEKTGFNYPTYLDIFADFSLRDPIASFEISGMPKFEAGEEFRDAFVLESEYENCELTVYWMDEEWNDVEEDAFVAGKTYILQLEAYSSGYERFAEDFVFVIDGKTYAADEWSECQAFLNIIVAAKEPADPDMPATGDPFAPLLWVALAVVGLMGTVVLVKTKH